MQLYIFIYVLVTNEKNIIETKKSKKRQKWLIMFQEYDILISDVEIE